MTFAIFAIFTVHIISQSDIIMTNEYNQQKEKTFIYQFILTRVYRYVLVTRVYRQLQNCLAVWADSITQERHYIFQ